MALRVEALLRNKAGASCAILLWVFSPPSAPWIVVADRCATQLDGCYPTKMQRMPFSSAGVCLRRANLRRATTKYEGHVPATITFYVAQAT